MFYRTEEARILAITSLSVGVGARKELFFEDVEEEERFLRQSRNVYNDNNVRYNLSVPHQLGKCLNRVYTHETESEAREGRTRDVTENGAQRVGPVCHLPLHNGIFLVCVAVKEYFV